MKSSPSYLSVSLLLWICLLQAFPSQAENEDFLSRTIYLPKAKGSIYELLEKVSEASGYLFIYDSDVIDNERIAEIAEGEYSIRKAIYSITDNSRLLLRIIGNHIVIEPPADTTDTSATDAIEAKDSIPTHFTVEGTIVDLYTKEPIPFATVGVPSDAIGTITNQNGEFRLRLPDSLRNTIIHFSHLGYTPKASLVAQLINQPQAFTLEPKVISIQEIVVRLVNPLRLIRDMLDKRNENYANQPVYLTSFYREGIERKKGFVNLTEAVFKIYKAPINSSSTADQIKLLKMRKISNEAEKDTLVTKFKSGIQASLMLDLIKNLPDFLEETERDKYNFVSSDITVIDNRIANVISFEQKKNVNEPLFRGELYIDSKNDALLSARFELHPKYVEKSANVFVVRKSRNIDIKPQQVSYTVSYKQWNGVYYINHIRGDLHFRVKKKRQLFGNTSVHTWFEMVTCKIETQQVTRFSRNETIPSHSVFSEINFAYDEAFWGDFNVILPEEKLSESISKITAKIEETGY